MKKAMKSAQEAAGKYAELNKMLLSSLPHPAMYIRRIDRVVLAANKIASDMGVKIGGHCWRDFGRTDFIAQPGKEIAAKYPEAVPAEFGIKCSFCQADECFLDASEQNHSEINAFGLIWDAYWIKVSNDVFLHYAVNITQRKQAEEALKKSEERYRFISENISDLIWIYNFTQGKFTYISPSVYQLRGYTVAEAMAENLSDSLSADSALKLISDLPVRVSEFLNGIRTTYIDQAQQSCKDGSVKWIETATKYQFAKDRTIEVHGVSRDISVRKQVETELQLKNESLYKINAEKDKFFSILAHDLRGPSIGFLGLTELMAEGLSHMTLDEIQKTALLMRNSAANLFRLLGNLLEWSRMQRGLASFVPTSFLLMPKISEMIASVLEAANLKEITIGYAIPKDLIVFADEQMLGGIMRNLVSNAVKFTAVGGSITVSAKSASDKSVDISVKDTGIGMNRHMIDHLFNLDVNTNRKGTEGEYSTGFGLIISKDLIEKHGGELWIESEEGFGSTFRFSLPANQNRETTATCLEN